MDFFDFRKTCGLLIQDFINTNATVIGKFRKLSFKKLAQCRVDVYFKKFH